MAALALDSVRIVVQVQPVTAARPLLRATSFNSQPKVPYVQIFSYLGIIDIIKCEFVCRAWKRIASNNQIWRVFYEKTYGQHPIRRHPSASKLLDYCAAFGNVPRNLMTLSPQQTFETCAYQPDKKFLPQLTRLTNHGELVLASEKGDAAVCALINNTWIVQRNIPVDFPDQKVMFCYLSDIGKVIRIYEHHKVTMRSIYKDAAICPVFSTQLSHIMCLSLSPSEKYLAIANRERVEIYHFKESGWVLQAVEVFAQRGAISIAHLKWSPNEACLVIGFSNGSIIIRDKGKLKALLATNSGELPICTISSIAFLSNECFWLAFRKSCTFACTFEKGEWCAVEVSKQPECLSSYPDSKFMLKVDIAPADKPLDRLHLLLVDQKVEHLATLHFPTTRSEVHSLQARGKKVCLVRTNGEIRTWDLSQKVAPQAASGCCVIA